jgi:hypothetical protein
MATDAADGVAFHQIPFPQALHSRELMETRNSSPSPSEASNVVRFMLRAAAACYKIGSVPERDKERMSLRALVVRGGEEIWARNGLSAPQQGTTERKEQGLYSFAAIA